MKGPSMIPCGTIQHPLRDNRASVATFACSQTFVCVQENTCLAIGKRAKTADVYLLATATENEEGTPKRAETGLTGWIDCFPKSRLAGTLFCGGVTMPRDIEGNGKLQEAYEMGKNV